MAKPVKLHVITGDWDPVIVYVAWVGRHGKLPKYEVVGDPNIWGEDIEYTIPGYFTDVESANMAARAVALEAKQTNVANAIIVVSERLGRFPSASQFGLRGYERENKPRRNDTQSARIMGRARHGRKYAPATLTRASRKLHRTRYGPRQMGLALSNPPKIARARRNPTRRLRDIK